MKIRLCVGRACWESEKTNISYRGNHNFTFHRLSGFAGQRNANAEKKTYKMIHKAEIYNMNYGGSYVLHTHRIFPIQKTIHIYFLSAAVIIYCFGLCRTRGQAKHKIIRRVWWCWRMSVSAWAMRNKNKNRNAVIMRSIWSSLGCQTDSASEPRPSRANNWAPGIY